MKANALDVLGPAFGKLVACSCFDKADGRVEKVEQLLGILVALCPQPLQVSATAEPPCEPLEDIVSLHILPVRIEEPPAHLRPKVCCSRVVELEAVMQLECYRFR